MLLKNTLKFLKIDNILKSYFIKERKIQIFLTNHVIQFKNYTYSNT